MKMYRFWVAVFGVVFSLASLVSFHYDIWLGLITLITCICFITYVFTEESYTKG